MVNGLKALLSERAIVPLEFIAIDMSCHLDTIKGLDADCALGGNFNDSAGS